MHAGLTGRLSDKHLPILLGQLTVHAAKWRLIGTHLKFRSGELDNIEARPKLSQGAPTSFLGALLEEWIQWAPEDGRGSLNFATLDSLKSALKEAGLGAASHDLCLE